MPPKVCGWTQPRWHHHVLLELWMCVHFSSIPLLGDYDSSSGYDFGYSEQCPGCLVYSLAGTSIGGSIPPFSHTVCIALNNSLLESFKQLVLPMHLSGRLEWPHWFQLDWSWNHFANPLRLFITLPDPCQCHFVVRMLFVLVEEDALFVTICTFS